MERGSETVPDFVQPKGGVMNKIKLRIWLNGTKEALDVEPDNVTYTHGALIFVANKVQQVYPFSSLRCFEIREVEK